MENEKNSIFKSWEIGSKVNPLIIAGPCSAESESQIMSIGTKLKTLGVNVFRAGIWKPRTRPNSFEGVGAIGLPWLKLLKQELGIKVAVEVANAKHVHEALKADVDILWIGARTSVNPFSIQEIADSLKGTDVPILVKNPINPDVDLWQGAIERIIGAGIDKIAAVHRGFSSFNNTIYRNVPMWELPIELRRRMPDIPMICDPSHIGGKRTMIQEISQKAMDLNYDGLMIECHTDPDNAWSDAAQQVTPKRLIQIMKDLKIRDKTSEGEDYQNQLNNLRSQIDVADQNLLTTLGKRMKVAKDIGKLKSDNNVAILQNKRWNEILGKMILDGEDHGLSEEFILKFFKAIHQESINNQKKILNK